MSLNNIDSIEFIIPLVRFVYNILIKRILESIAFQTKYFNKHWIQNHQGEKKKKNAMIL